MTELTQLRNQHHDVNVKIAELNQLDDLTDEQVAELEALTATYITLQKRMKAAELLEEEQKRSAPPAQDGSAQEFDELLESASVATIMGARVQNRMTDGAERELQQHFGLDSNQIPHAMLWPQDGDGERQDRALTASSGDAQTNQAQGISGPFPSGFAAFANVERRSVQPGTYAIPVITVPAPGAAAVPAATSGTTAVTATAQTVVLQNATPSRHLSVSIDWSEQQARTIPNLREMLGRNVSELVTAAADRDVIAGATDGLTSRGTAPSASSTVENFNRFRQKMANAVDGNYARTMEDVKALVRQSTYAVLVAAYRSGNNTEISVAEWAEQNSGGLLVCPYLATASDNDQALIIRGNWPSSCVQVMWDDLTIEDPYTDARTRQTRLTMTQFTDIVVPRAGVYTRHSIHTA